MKKARSKNKKWERFLSKGYITGYKPLYAYQCEVCGGYHISGKKSKAVKLSPHRLHSLSEQEAEQKEKLLPAHAQANGKVNLQHNASELTSADRGVNPKCFIRVLANAISQHSRNAERSMPTVSSGCMKAGNASKREQTIRASHTAMCDSIPLFTKLYAIAAFYRNQHQHATV